MFSIHNDNNLLLLRKITILQEAPYRWANIAEFANIAVIAWAFDIFIIKKMECVMIHDS
jgi:hypothetical protein